jgi:hypothetical protein
VARRFVKRKPKFPQHRTNLGIDDPELGARPEALKAHRELEHLRAAGPEIPEPGAHRPPGATARRAWRGTMKRRRFRKSFDEGIHQISAERYHADPCRQPSLSSHIASLMCSRSPRHAWAAHPRLNPDFERMDEAKFDMGTATHALLLQGEQVCHVVEADDWRTKVAKEVRDKAREEGLIPLLPHQWEQVKLMCDSVRAQLSMLDLDPQALTEGHAERALIWEEDGVWCRALVDWLHDDHTAIDDLKTTGTSAHPDEWGRRTMWNIGADVQVAFYLRGLRKLTGQEADFRFLVVENAPPFAVSAVSLAPSALDLANDKVEWAIAKWRECTRTGVWPAYSTSVARTEAPPWEMERWLEARQVEYEEAQAA